MPRDDYQDPVGLREQIMGSLPTTALANYTTDTQQIANARVIFPKLYNGERHGVDFEIVVAGSPRYRAMVMWGLVRNAKDKAWLSGAESSTLNQALENLFRASCEVLAMLFEKKRMESIFEQAELMDLPCSGGLLADCPGQDPESRLAG